MLREIATSTAPKPIGAYSQGIVAGDFLFTAGQGPIDPETGVVVGSTIKEQTEQAIRNIEQILAAAGAGLSDVAKVTVHLANLADFGQFDKVYSMRFTPPRPVRTTVGSNLLGILVELDVVAIVPSQGG